MNFYFAPLEGITRYIFRNAYEKYYGGMDKYFAPFISPTDNCFLTPKNIRELCPENNDKITLIPQILTNKPVAFIGAAKELKSMGYNEINLNLGCPSGTVCAKRKGAGLLSEWYELEKLLDGIFEWAGNENVKLSVKTRLGRFEPDEFYDILEIYNKYPIYELIIHPRVEKDYYKGEPRLDFYEYAVKNSDNPVVYNGNLFTPEDIKKHDNKESVMLGRGLLYNPELAECYNYMSARDEDTESKESTGNNTESADYEFNFKRFWDFHDEIYHSYQELMSGDKNVLFHMKELWTYWKALYNDCEREIKHILKSKNSGEYEAALRILK